MEARLSREDVEASARLLDGGRQVYPLMLEAIRGARSEVFLEVYAFSPEGIGAEFIAALSAAARRAVRVRVVIDAWGSAPATAEVEASLAAAGCDVQVFGSILGVLAGRLRRNHRKIFAVDSELAIVGGLNIGDAYGVPDPAPRETAWADLAVALRGPVAAWLQERGRRERGWSPPGPVRVWLSGLGGGKRLRRRYLKAFGRARDRILLAHAYFLPDRHVVRSIAAAARRGVEVKLVVAGRSDVPLVGPATRRLYRKLLRAGVEVSEWTRSVLHAKAAAVDGRRLLVGSFNLDPFSLANLEALAEVALPGPAADAERWIRERFAEGERVTLERIGAGSRAERFLAERVGPIVAAVARGIARHVLRRR
ncbi:MAG TPA: phospholipase D-like domain-containing protein [Anaeromyxobacter sp.]|nr:phospholipase D-like domain-containing protein [Anaeromyxobacter sp.]